MHGPLTRDSALAPASFPGLEAAYLALLRTATDESEFRIAPPSNVDGAGLGAGCERGRVRVRGVYQSGRRRGDQAAGAVPSGRTTPPPVLDPPQLWLNARAPQRVEDAVPARLTVPSDA
jgi:hypothetical protein